MLTAGSALRRVFINWNSYELRGIHSFSRVYEIVKPCHKCLLLQGVRLGARFEKIVGQIK